MTRSYRTIKIVTSYSMCHFHSITGPMNFVERGVGSFLQPYICQTYAWFRCIHARWQRRVLLPHFSHLNGSSPHNKKIAISRLSFIVQKCGLAFWKGHQNLQPIKWFSITFNDFQCTWKLKFSPPPMQVKFRNDTWAVVSKCFTLRGDGDWIKVAHLKIWPPSVPRFGVEVTW